MHAASKWLPWALGGLAFVLYSLVAPSGFFWLDSAELSAGGLGLGSAHPTGFPLYMMLVKLAGLVPVGELAFRVNLLSALCAATAVGGLAVLILRLREPDACLISGALAAGATLMVSLVFARQATVAEAYAPTAAALVGSLLLYDAVARGGGANTGLCLAWLAGLSFGLHPLYRFLMGLPILALFGWRLYRGARWPLLAPALTLLGACAMQLYLPVRSATGRISGLDWGHPRTLSAAYEHLSSEGLHKAFADEVLSRQSEIVSVNLHVFAEQLVDHLGIICLMAAFFGLVTLFRDRRSRWLGSALLTGLVLDVVYSVWLNPMGLADLQNGVPTAIFLCAATGVAVTSIARMAGRAGPFAGAVCLAVLVVPPALLGMDAIARVGQMPRRVSESVLEDSDPGAIVFTQSDNLTAGLLYLTQVEGMRPDIAALVVPMLADTERARELVLATSFSKARYADDWSRPVATIAKGRRPLYWERGEIAPPEQVAGMKRLVDRIATTAPDLDTEKLADASVQLAELYRHDGLRDRSARRHMASSLTHLGRRAYGLGELERAADLFRGAVELRPEHHSGWTNLGVVYARQGRAELAVEAAERALQYSPNRPVALINAARYRMIVGDLEAAQRHAERALRVSPQKAGSWNMAGLVDLQRGNRVRARERLERALALDPHHREARGALNAIAAESPSD